MESLKFIGRRKEMDWLERNGKEDQFRFLVITGRRRIGKTRLINEYLRDKDHFRVQFEKKRAESNLDRMNTEIGRQMGIPKPSFSSFTEAFEYLRDSDVRIVVLDEFSYIIRYGDVSAEFQTIIDEVLQGSNMMLIVLGSSFSIMKKELFEYNAPLYGRSNGMLNLQPLTIEEVMKWFPEMSMEDIFILYSAVGGIPRYLEMFREEGLEKQIKDGFFDPNNFLFREAKLLIEEEFDDPSTYYSILESISKGCSKVTQIGKGSFISPHQVSKYLSILVDIGIVKKVTPYGQKRKQGIYRFKDDYYRFWFMFVSDVFEEIESFNNGGALLRYETERRTFMGRAFEEIVQGIIPSIMPFDPLRTGPWWKGAVEIDLVAEGIDDICFIEVKWMSMGIMDLQRVIGDLKERAGEYGRMKKKVHLAVVCKKKKGDPKIEEDHIHVFDLDDIKRIIG